MRSKAPNESKRRGTRTLIVAAIVVIAAALVLPAGSTAASKWGVVQLPAKQLEGGHGDQVALYSVSCPSEKLCVAVGALDTVAVSRSPAGGRESWRVGYPTYARPEQGCLGEEGVPPASCSFPRGSLDGVSCAGEELCVAVGKEGSVYVSTDPTGGSWSIGTPDQGQGAPHLTAVSCPSASLCVAVSGENGAAAGRVFTTNAPTSGQWQSAQLTGSPDLRAVSCTTTAICVAGAKGGRIFVSTDPTGGADSWREVGSPTRRDLEGVSCVATFLCAAGDGGGNILTATDPAGSNFTATNAGGSVQITDVTCPTTTNCVAVDNNGDVMTSTDPGGGATAWTFENLVPFEADSSDHGQFVKNALWGASCPSVSLCVLVGANSRIFSATDPFAVPAASTPGGDPAGKKATRKRPRTHLVFAEGFWKSAVTRHRRFKARFHFYSRDGAQGFECRRDRGPWRRCHSPLRYWVAAGRHTLRVRAIGPSGLRGPAAMVRFKVVHRRPR
jgi:hypothetical protein